ncbi:hypothetical protein GCM10009790_13460 [Georgenia ruanii]
MQVEMRLREGLEVTHLVESATGPGGRPTAARPTRGRPAPAAGAGRRPVSGSCPWVNRRHDVMHYEP